MLTKFCIFTFGLILGLAGCQPVPGTPSGTSPSATLSSDDCGASELQFLIGKSTLESLEALQAADPSVSQNAALNIEYDDDGNVSRVYCK